ncbi:hypothetical protein HS088_TW16G00027 [Tripterygium wilfordii]|uniref:DNA-3-methyladenine glycosylase I n=1 Tax=Tripterygium wilfordii TaxID=458696 RepID=A0A7J7CHQ9_TRIWF|nr:probable GMP synthase [glutamine-hydrolyzing] [Tripterygium wilfordii]KAF5733587.1 hypothetical protein HS088_TW16G00027 [Tripterygium wilfordii]
MCHSKFSKPDHINGRPVLQPKSNQVPVLERRSSLKKVSPRSPTLSPKSSPISTASTRPSLSPPISPKLKSPKSSPLLKTRNNDKALNLTTELSPVKKAKKAGANNNSVKVEAPGSIAAKRREQVATMQEQRKLRIAHYGRTKSAKLEKKVVPIDSSSSTSTITQEENRCGYMTSNSDPVYVAYHDEEWGVPVHDDMMLFELLVLTAAQLGSDWTSALKKRQSFREAFSGFDAEVVAKFTEKKITSISADYSIDLSLIRGIVDNSKGVLQVKKEFGSFDKYLWRFVSHKPICTQYRSCHKVPFKTSKSETISKDMVKRGFRFVGPTIVYSFMQAAGLTNDHLITCPQHIQCTSRAISTS